MAFLVAPVLVLPLFISQHQVLAEFRFGEETAGKIYSGVGDECKVQDLGPDARFSYEEELQAFLDEKKTKNPISCVVG